MDWGPYVLALLGIFGTIAVAYASQRWQREERRETQADLHRWEDERRWVADRRNIYARFLAAADDISIPASLQIAGQQQLDATEQSAAVDRLILSHTQLDLVASDEVRESALRLHNATIDMMHAVSGQSTAAADQVESEFGDARRAFVGAARRDLGL